MNEKSDSTIKSERGQAQPISYFFKAVIRTIVPAAFYFIIIAYFLDKVVEAQKSVADPIGFSVFAVCVVLTLVVNYKRVRQGIPRGNIIRTIKVTLFVVFSAFWVSLFMFVFFPVIFGMALYVQIVGNMPSLESPVTLLIICLILEIPAYIVWKKWNRSRIESIQDNH